MMPAMSPFMTTGTITRWNKKEGEAFAAGDVLLQIESDIATIDVEAESSGVLGKILVSGDIFAPVLFSHHEVSSQLPDGSQNIPVEQVIALVVNDRGLTNIPYQAGPIASPYNPIPSSPSRSMISPTRTESFNFNQPFLSPIHRSPTLAEMQHGHHHHRGMAMRHARGQKLTIVPPSPRLTVSLPIIDRSAPPAQLHTAPVASSVQTPQDPEPRATQDTPVDGAAIRRMFRSNLSRAPLSAASYRSPLTSSRYETKDYFDGIL
ncbi:hypothetical protein DXG01_016868 [Tephrocybe rancida]|nr:hypothetical protein DXG01_016868 [Tephrocybe rancida]